MKFRTFFIVALPCFLVSFRAWAQAPSSVPPAGLTSTPATAEALPARHFCPKPAVPLASKKPEPAEMNAFVSNLDAFRDCVQAFAQAQQKIAEMHQKNADTLAKSAQASVAAGNAAIKEYNDLVEQANRTFKDKTQ